MFGTRIAIKYRESLFNFIIKGGEILYGIKESIYHLEKSSYAKDNEFAEDLQVILDCSSGINPFGFSKLAISKLQEIPIEMINSYPKSNKDIKEAIIKSWLKIIELNKSQIILGDGSIELIYKINKLFIDKNSIVLGYSPQFTDFIDDIKSYGARYEHYPMDLMDNFKFDSNLFLKKMNKNHKLFYLDNPNNPTGQVIDIDHVEEIVKRAKDLSKIVIIDEAYGDFMAPHNSAIRLTKKYDNLIVVRTFSKGLGLAGLRAGYIVTSNKLAEQYHKISNPFEMSGLARYLAVGAIEDHSFMSESIRMVKANKEQFLDSLNKITVLDTDCSVPIMVLRHPDNNIDFQRYLLKYGVLTVSGEGFIGLGKNYIRLLTPQNIDLLVKIFKEVDKEI